MLWDRASVGSRKARTGHVGDDGKGICVLALGFVWAGGTQAPALGWKRWTGHHLASRPGVSGLPATGRGASLMEVVGAGPGAPRCGNWGGGALGWGRYCESTTPTWPPGSQARSEGGSERPSSGGSAAWGHGGAAARLPLEGSGGAGRHPVFSGVFSGCLGGSRICERDPPPPSLVPWGSSREARDCHCREKPMRGPERRLRSHVPGAPGARPL